MSEKCMLCPRLCGAERSDAVKGVCGCRETVRVARAAPHCWEEPCISGTRGSGTVFFSGCNLKCVFCQNSQLSRDYTGIDVSDDRLSDIFLELQGLGAHNINLVTPTPWVKNIKYALDRAWERGLYIPTVYNCGGYELSDTIRSLRGYIGVYLPDFKYMSPELSRSLSGVSDYPEKAKAALYEMVGQRGEPVFDSDGIMQKGVIVRHLVLPGHTEDSMKVISYLHSEYGDSIYISLMNQYTPVQNIGLPPELSRELTESEYSEVIDYARSVGVKLGFTQEGGTAKESFIPRWNGEGVRGNGENGRFLKKAPQKL